MQIHPVHVYRWWNTYDHYCREYEHLSTSWLIVEPFLNAHGYRLKRKRDTGKYKEEDGDQLLYDSETRGATSVSYFGPSVHFSVPAPLIRTEK